MEDITNYAWDNFLKEKSKLKNVMLGLIKNLKIKYGIQVHYAHCNNARENVDFELVCKQEGKGIKFEYTAPDTPHQNDHLEQKLANLFNMLHAMLNSGKLSAFLRHGL